MTMRNDDATLKNNLPPNIITVIERGDDRIANGYLIREMERTSTTIQCFKIIYLDFELRFSLSLSMRKKGITFDDRSTHRILYECKIFAKCFTNLI